MNEKKEDGKQTFESSVDPTIIPRGIKIDGTRSRFAKQVQNKQIFEKRANEAFDKIQERQQQILELGSKYLSLMKDKTLFQNKGPTDFSIEKEILGNLISFAIEVNTDEVEPEGMGSVGLLTLLFKSAILMRDNFNQVEYRLEQLEKQIAKSSPQFLKHDK